MIKLLEHEFETSKNQLSLKILRNVIILIITALKFHSSNYVGDNVGKVTIVFTFFFFFFIAKMP